MTEPLTAREEIWEAINHALADGRGEEAAAGDALAIVILHINIRAEWERRGGNVGAAQALEAMVKELER